TGADVALITTKGFRDVMEIGREWRYDIYDLDLVAPPHLIERERRLEIDERTMVDGSVLRPVDVREAEALVEALPASVQAVAICLLHSYANPSNERALAEVIDRLRPDLHVSLSCDVAPERREFERMMTTGVNAYVQPLARPYLSSLED